MNTGRKRSALSYIPGYKNNAVLQLIIASGTAYVMLSVTWAIMMIVYQDAGNFNQYFLTNLALPHITGFKNHWWTLLTYGWFHFPNGFWELVSNMLWLYCFGSVVQMLLGHRQVIPLFVYSLVAGGICYMLAQMLPGEWGKCPPTGIIGPRAGLMALAAAAITLTPSYRFYLTETFSLRLVVVAGVFAVLMVFGSGFYLPMVIMLAGGAGAGFGYVKLLKAGYRPGEWMYSFPNKVESLVTPDENAVWKKNTKRRDNLLNQYASKNGVSQKRVDDILDKINQKGFNALTTEEKDILMRAGKE